MTARDELVAALQARISEERAVAQSYPLGDTACVRHGGVRDGLKEALELLVSYWPEPADAPETVTTIVSVTNSRQSKNDYRVTFEADLEEVVKVESVKPSGGWQTLYRAGGLRSSPPGRAPRMAVSLARQALAKQRSGSHPA